VLNVLGIAFEYMAIYLFFVNVLKGSVVESLIYIVIILAIITLSNLYINFFKKQVFKETGDDASTYQRQVIERLSEKYLADTGKPIDIRFADGFMKNPQMFTL